MPIPAKLCAVLPTLRGSYIIALPIKRHAQYAATQKSSNAIGNEVLVTTITGSAPSTASSVPMIKNSSTITIGTSYSTICIEHLPGRYTEGVWRFGLTIIWLGGL